MPKQDIFCISQASDVDFKSKEAVEALLAKVEKAGAKISRIVETAIRKYHGEEIPLAHIVCRRSNAIH